MTQTAYTVTARMPSSPLLDRYVRWLSEGHVKAVCDAGTSSATVVVLDPVPGEPLTVHVRYLFPDREALERYLANHAPRLRAEGLALFGPETGITFERSIGRVAHAEPNR